MSLAAGTRLGPYEILAQLGAGGMGEVWRARDTKLGRVIALKVLPEAWAADPDRLARFEREAKAVAALSHPNIVTLHSVDEIDGVRFFTMELVDGTTLANLIPARGLSEEALLQLAIPLTDALAAAHARGVIHRDLKPGNVMVTADRRVKVLDFGLAKVISAGSSSGDPDVTLTAGLTRVGEIFGTAAYMSPEQARGEPVDERSDLFSLGVVLYEMATGRLPFEGKGAAELQASILTRAPAPPSRLNPAVTARLEDTLLKLLEKDPALRYPSAAGVRGDLLRLQRDATAPGAGSVNGVDLAGGRLPVKETTIGGLGWWRWRGLVAAAAVVVIAGLALWWSRGSRSPEPAAGASTATPAAAARTIAVLPFVNLSSDTEQEYFSDGLSEELLNLLTKIPTLRVTSRSSAFSFKGRNVPIAEVARQLHVAHILEGSVRKSGERVRITAQLIEARSDTHLWSETYDRTLEDIFAVQDEIASAVVAQLKITLLGAAPRARDVDPKAFALFLQARQTARETFDGAMERASALYQQALAVDPDYLEAWVGLASCYSGQANEGRRPIDEALRLSRDALGKALAIDPDYAPAHALLGGLAVWWDGDLAAAAKHYVHALSLGPSDPGILASATVLTRSLGRLEESIAFTEFVAARDPVNADRYLELAEAYRLGGHLEDAIATYRIAQRQAPGVSLPPYTLGFAQLLKGESQEALASMLPAGEDVIRLAGSAMANHSLGRHTESDAVLAEMIEKGEKFAAYNVACVLAYRQESDRAFEWLNKALANRDPGLKSEIVLEPLLASLHEDPRWLPFLRKIGRDPEQLAAIEFKVTLPE